LIDLNELTLVGKGMTADVYLFEDGRIVKLFNENFAEDAASYEAEIARIIGETQVNAPGYFGTISINNRPGILYEHIEGEIFTDVLLKDIIRSFPLIRKLAAEHCAINRMYEEKLPAQIDRLSLMIGRADLIESRKSAIIEHLKKIATKHNICHGDFHPGNVIRSADGLCTIDWMNCYSGNAEGDALRTYLMLASPYLPGDFTPLNKLFILMFKKLLARVYLKEYMRVSGIRKKDLRPWMPVIIAVRLSDRVPGEEAWLMKLLEKHIRKLERY